MKKLTFVLFILLSFTSCVHKSPFIEEYYFQSMGDESEIVITADVNKMNESENFHLSDSSLSKEISKRAERLSVALEPKTLEKYPLEISDYTIYGAAEGNFGSFVVGTALSWNKTFKKEKDNGLKYYTNGSMSLGIPKNGIVLFSTGDYAEAERKTISERVIKIPYDTARYMASSTLAIFINKPETLLDIGFDFPQTTLNQIKECVLVIDEKDDLPAMSGVLTMWDEGGAKTMTTLLKNQLIQSIRRSGEKVDVKAIAHYFNADSDKVIIDRFLLPEDMIVKTRNLLEGI